MPPKKNKLSQKKTPQKPTKVYKVHEVQFAGKPALIVCPSKAGDALPCPLLGLCNLLLRNAGSSIAVLDTVKRSDGTRSVTPQEAASFCFWPPCSYTKWKCEGWHYGCWGSRSTSEGLPGSFRWFAQPSWSVPDAQQVRFASTDQIFFINSHLLNVFNVFQS